MLYSRRGWSPLQSGPLYNVGPNLGNQQKKNPLPYATPPTIIFSPRQNRRQRMSTLRVTTPVYCLSTLANKTILCSHPPIRFTPFLRATFQPS
jgi:hypothetical protein